MAELQFEEAAQKVKTLPKQPPPKVLLELYSLFKQATAGDAGGERPGLLDLRGRAKFDAWAARRGMDMAAARRAYVELVDKLLRDAGLSG